MEDQFGGEYGKKLLAKRFKKILAETAVLSMKDQREQLEKELNDWINYNGGKYPQIDDITLIGLKIQ
ncbi:MAG: hypothetical protein NTX93_09505 [Bacteroidia bacterium]|nr:hypothetical protein [Bacteroidia bacterium]